MDYLLTLIEEATPGASTPPSITVDVSREYAKAYEVEPWEKGEPNQQQQLLLSQLLKSNRNGVQEALKLDRTRTPSFIGRVSTFCELSEKTCHLLLLLHHSVQLVRSLYAPLHDLVDALPPGNGIDSTNVFEIFLRFDKSIDRFPFPPSDIKLGMHLCVSELLPQLLQKSRVHLGRRVGRTTSSVTVCLTAHALLSLAATSVFPAFLPWRFTKKEIGKREVDDMAKLYNTRLSAYIIDHYLGAIRCLVNRLTVVIDMDTRSIRFGLENGEEAIYLAVEELRKHRTELLNHLTSLEEQICLCFAVINRARSMLLRGIHLQQTYFDYMTQ